MPFVPALVLVAIASLCLAPAAGAQTLNLSLSQYTISFPSADPDASPMVAAPSISVNYRVRDNASGSWRITVQASGDLTSGTATIPISSVTWTASPTPPFQNGTMSAAVAQTLASGSGNVTSNSAFGTVVFSLANSWSYNIGTYTASFVFTLSAP
jgi:hypothetical protein